MTVIVSTTKNRSETKSKEKKNRRCDIVHFCISMEYEPKREREKKAILPRQI
jgi:hypothetical protein